MTTLQGLIEFVSVPINAVCEIVSNPIKAITSNCE